MRETMTWEQRISEIEEFVKENGRWPSNQTEEEDNSEEEQDLPYEIEPLPPSDEDEREDLEGPDVVNPTIEGLFRDRNSDSNDHETDLTHISNERDGL